MRLISLVAGVVPLVAMPFVAAAALPRDTDPLLSSAQMWASKNRPELARDNLAKILKAKPDHAGALLTLGLLEIRSNQPDEAAKHLAHLQKSAPNAPETRELAEAYRIATTDRQTMARVRLLARTGKGDEASALLKRLFPTGAPAGALGVEYWQIIASAPKGFAAARAGLESRLKADPRDTEAALALAELLIGEGAETRPQGMKRIVTLAAQPATDRVRALQIWRRGLVSAGEDLAYMPWFEDFARLQPDDKEINGMLKALQGAKVAQQRLLADPNYQTQQRGLRLLDKGQLADAESALFSALKARGDDPELLGGIGLLRLRQGQHSEAVRYFSQAKARAKEDDQGKWIDLITTARFWGALAAAEVAQAAGRFDAAEASIKQALALQPNDADALSAWGGLQAARRDSKGAEALFRRALAIQPDHQGALRGLAEMLSAAGRVAEAQNLLQAFARRFPSNRTDTQAIEADLLKAQADQFLVVGQNGRALDALERAVKLSPSAAWTRFALARLYQRLALPDLGAAVMAEGAQAAPATANPEMHYARALYLSLADQLDAAQQALNAVPAAQRSPAMQQLATRLTIGLRLVEARRLQSIGRADAAEAVLQAVTPVAAADPDLLADVAAAWIDAGQANRGLALVRGWLDRQPAAAAPEMRVRYARLLSRARHDRDLTAWLDTLDALPTLTAPQRADVLALRSDVAYRQVSALQAAGNYAAAQAALAKLAPTPAQATADPTAQRRYWLAEADLAFARKQPAQAATWAQRALALSDTDNDARLTLARALQEQKQSDAALKVLAEVLNRAARDDLDIRLGAARRLTVLRRDDQAEAILRDLAPLFPDSPALTVQTGRLAQARQQYDTAAALYQKARDQEQASGIRPEPNGEPTAAQAALDDLDARRQGRVETAYYTSSKSGDDGISRFNLTEVPVYGRVPFGYHGHAFAHADQLRLSSGRLDGQADTARDYGKIAALGNQSLPYGGEQQAKGTFLAAGYEADQWRADIGLTPSTFPVSYLTGGLRLNGEWQDNTWSVDVSRRPVTSSVLSFAGAKDPVTGEVWGGVRRTGSTVRLSRDLNEAVSVSGAVGVGVLSGENVPTNRELSLRSGVDWTVLNDADQRVNTGMTLSWSQYGQNLGGYTFGQGGYYSPQSNVSLGVPIEWTGRQGWWSWQLAGALGYSQTRSDGSDFYPDRPDLQAAAVSRANALGFGAPVRDGSSGGGVSYSAQGALEARVTPQWVLGGLFQFDRSEDYAPDRFALYLRYHFEPQKGAVPYPPRPVTPYSRY